MKKLLIQYHKTEPIIVIHTELAISQKGFFFFFGGGVRSLEFEIHLFLEILTQRTSMRRSKKLLLQLFQTKMI